MPPDIADNTPFTLRLLTEADVPALQRVYDAAPAAFDALLGRPAAPDQAAADLLQGLLEEGRYQFGIFLGDEMIGAADCRLAASVAGQAQIGALLLAEPYDAPAIAGLALRIVERWLCERFGVRQVEVGVPAHESGEIAFWQEAGYSFTGEQYRRELERYAPRFLVMRRALDCGP